MARKHSAEVRSEAIQALDPSTEHAVNQLPLVDIDDSAMFTSFGDISDPADVDLQEPRCPNPTRWALVGQARARGRFVSFHPRCRPSLRQSSTLSERSEP
jgi:hypothetical protein